MRKLYVWLVLMLTPMGVIAEDTLVVDGYTLTIICKSEEALTSLVETIYNAPLLEAESTYKNPAGCAKIRIRVIDVNSQTHNVIPTKDFPGFTHIVKVDFGSKCNMDGQQLGECHMLLLRSILFGIHGDFFKNLVSISPHRSPYEFV
ncbi:hypothetical protein FEI13_18160 [Halomonas urmiana]|uniref:Uncharacterized protein n=1 Tax=Halomonas urmiana TaxID=490901 RepID=A0A5R8M7C1_9GAMM|nr:hypothetical protein [Halomonas urmiana]TLF45443.1 hypothetical protein FEI13_18160 [Halomonas urmiana]